MAVSALCFYIGFVIRTAFLGCLKKVFVLIVHPSVDAETSGSPKVNVDKISLPHLRLCT